MRRLLLAALLAAAPAVAQTPADAQTAAYAAPDYARASNWLCRPGASDACAADIAVTNVAADGKATPLAAPTPRAPPAIDCFYVYPTVSTDAAPLSDMTADAAETSVARIQFAPFRNVCRTFAPLYRQVTLKALRDLLTGAVASVDRVTPYRDVVAAWNDYLARDNQGRGVILIGHSQGSGVLKSLIAGEIEGKPVAARVIAAYIPGTNVLVPAGKDVGGDLKATPICRAADQTGCIVAWVSFRDGAVPPADSLYGRTAQPGMTVACANPAALAGGPAPLQPWLPTATAIVDSAKGADAWAKGVTVTTPFVALPGLLRGECRDVAGANVLAIHTNADPADPRTDDIGGDVMFAGQPVPSWGLHLIDVNAVTGDLVDLARRQGEMWQRSRR